MLGGALVRTLGRGLTVGTFDSCSGGKLRISSIGDRVGGIYSNISTALPFFRTTIGTKTSLIVYRRNVD